MHISNIYVKYIPIVIWFSVFAACSIPISAQTNIIFEVYCDAKEVLAHEYFEVTFTLKNANGTNFSPPDFKGFIVVAGPNSSTSMQIVNGQVTREMGYSYTLKPEKEGKFTIGSASIKANNKALKTRPVSVKVLKGSQSTNKSRVGTGEAYVLIEPNKTEAYPGEQILLDFKLYTTVSLDGYDITEEPDYKGFFAQELRRFSGRTQREVVNGKQMTTKILRRIALFPQQAGQLAIPPAKIQLAMIEDNSRTGFFFSRNIKPIFIVTEPVSILVKDLPVKIPNDFTGAVGQFDFIASTNHSQITTDDAVSINMMITGNGDIKRVQPPPILLSDSFEIYPPKIIEENIKEENGELVGRKTIEYLVLPKYPGEYAIQPSFSYFNTEASLFEIIKSGPYPLFVKQGSDKHQSLSNSENKNLIAEDIRFIKQESKLTKKGDLFIGSPVFLIFTSLPFLAFIGLFIFKKTKSSVDENSIKTKHANKIALQRLTTAKGYLSTSSSRAFYNEISKASLGYVCDKINIPLSELSKDNVREKLIDMKISSSRVEDFMKIIQTCEMALFAGKDSSSDMKDTYEMSVALISGIEKEIGDQQ